MQIRDHEKRALQVLNGLNTHNCHRLIGHGFGPQAAAEIGWLIAQEKSNLIQEPFESFEQLESIGISDEDIDNLYHWALGVVADKHKKTLERLQMRYTARSTNRTRYLPEGVLQYRQFSKKQQDGSYESAQGWRFDIMLRSAGLLSLVVQELQGENAQPVAVQLVNMLPKAKNAFTGEEQSYREEVPPEEWTKANNSGIAVSGERLGWNMNSLGWTILKKAFPNAVSLSAYGHSLNSPVLPEGFWSKIPITLKKLTDADGNDLQTDGSGLWNTDHPAFEAFITKHGICPWQIRGIHPQHGVFVKGAVRPVNLGADGPAFVLDWNQVKGLKKKDALRHRDLGTEFVQKGMYIGCMQVWNKPRATLKSCFEMLENIRVCKETVEIVKSLVDDAIEDLENKGTDRILDKICSDEERTAQIVQLVNMLKERGADIDATQIPMIRTAVKGKLERILWHVAQGAGVAYKQRLCILDSTVEPGTIVATGYKPGTVVTSFRFPMVLAQGLRTLTVVPPKPHMLCNNKEVQCMVFMSPHDLTTCMQGDDDGDIVGISDDPRMVELFKYIIDPKIYHIEPEGKKIVHDMDSEAGLEYLRWDQRGPVGLATNYRSQLLAVGDIEGANAMSIMIQECVDAAKRKPEWSDFRAAAEMRNWTQNENGEYHFKIRLSHEELEDGTIPIKMMREWVHQRLIDRGCAKVVHGPNGSETRPDNACAWRWPNKKIDLDKWVPTTHRTGYRGGNLVHICHDYAFEKFNPLRPMFNLDKPLINISALLPTMLAMQGIYPRIQVLDWNTYNSGLRKKAGLLQFGQQIERIYRKGMDSEEHLRAIDDAIAQLNHNLETAELDLDEIVTIWVMETDRVDANTGMPLPAGINNAFRVLSIPNNPVMVALGITKSASCQWMLKPIKTRTGPMRRLDLAVEISMSKKNPQEHLANAIFSDTQHFKECHDEDGRGIHLWECTTCKNMVTDALIRKIRSNRQSTETQWMTSKIRDLNG